LLALNLAWLLLIAVADPVGNFGLDDDWVYALAVKEILRTGIYALPSPATANVVLQAYWGALFCLPAGFSFTALRVSTIVLGALGVSASYLLARELGADRRTSLACAASLGVNPIYFVLSNSFMTDVPFTALSATALWAFVKGLRADRAGWIAAGFALAFAALAIRQFALIFILVFGMAYVMRKGVTWRSLCVATLPLAAAIALQFGFQRWLIETGRTPVIVAGALQDVLPQANSPAIQIPFSWMPLLFIYLGLFMAPALMLLDAEDVATRAGRRWWLAGALAIFALILVGASAHLDVVMPLYRNVISAFGFGPLLLRDTFTYGLNFPPVPAALQLAWIVVTVISVLASVLLALLLLRTGRALVAAALRPSSWPSAWLPAMMMISVVLYGGILLVMGLHLGIFDRYLIVLIAPLWALAIHERGGRPLGHPSGWRFGVVGALIAAFALFSVAGTHDFLAFNRARLAATDTLARNHVASSQIDGGYEYNGFYDYDPNYRASPSKSYWWVVDDEYVISSGPLDGYCVIRSFPYQRWLSGAAVNVDILRRRAPATSANQPCPGATPS
jgi:hypothetical protein